MNESSLFLGLERKKYLSMVYSPKSGSKIVEQLDLTVWSLPIFDVFLENPHRQRGANTKKRAIPTTDDVFHEALRSYTSTQTKTQKSFLAGTKNPHFLLS